MAFFTTDIMRARLSAALLLFLVFNGAHRAAASQMAGFYTDVGFQVVLRNSSTEKITHSLCNVDGKTLQAYPPDLPVLPVKATPRNATNLAAEGSWNGTSIILAVWFQSDSSEIIHEIFTCDMSTGLYLPLERYGMRDSTPDSHPETGLAVALLGDRAGYRLYWHDTHRNVQFSKFTNDGWVYAGQVSPDQTLTDVAIGVGYYLQTPNVTVAFPKDNENIEISNLRLNFGTWHVSTFPRLLQNTSFDSTSNDTEPGLDMSKNPSFDLPGWTGSPGALGLVIDADDITSLFYIGSDRSLHMATSILANGDPSRWSLASDQDSNVWPLADRPNSDFALAYDLGSHDLAIVYFSQGVLNYVSRSGPNRWNRAMALPVASSSQTSSPAPAPTTSGPASSADLSAGVKAGIGVGSVAGALALVACVAGFFLHRRSARRRNQQQQHYEDDYPVQPVQQEPTELSGRKSLELAGEKSTITPQLEGQLNMVPAEMEGEMSPTPVTPYWHEGAR